MWGKYGFSSPETTLGARGAPGTPEELETRGVPKAPVAPGASRTLREQKAPGVGPWGRGSRGHHAVVYITYGSATTVNRPTPSRG